jgi:capsule polysaccharide export protein KpsE/RkpR
MSFWDMGYGYKTKLWGLLMNIGIFETFFVYLYKKRWLLIVNFLIACTAGVVYSFVFAKMEYSSSVTFLPPSGDNNMLSALSLMNLSMSSMALGGSSSEQVEVVFQSFATKCRIIDEFDLIKYFELEKSKNKYVLAVKRMKKYVKLSTSEKGGFGMTKTLSYSIICYHPSPDTAKQMADFTFAMVDSAIREISIDKAQRNRIFVESQIEVQNRKMDSLQGVFQEFQNVHKAYDVPEQARLSLKAYADLKTAALMNELRLATLRNEFSGATHEITQLRRNQNVYNAKLKEYEAGEDPNVIPSLDRSSKIFPEYAKMLRDIEVQNQLILFLTKELEQARLQEAKDVSPLIIVDPPVVPEYKSRPKRLKVLVVIIFAENLFFFGVLTYLFAFRTISKNDKFNSLLNSIKRG